ncbi:MAG: transcription elongation factor GreA [Alphaproteobacteria bacterium]|nr:transcription elongation factor GreA [Alphaproteobacteria bacterium]MBL0717809.1 transcription elongation factor GreA [Alphaproteobacteria bacterium]
MATPITNHGFEKLEKELKQLNLVDRPKIIEAISTARELGDLSENAEYHSAKERQGIIEGRIAEINSSIADSEVVNIDKLKGDSIVFGATVSLKSDKKELTFIVLSDVEADAEYNRISINSPIGAAILGKKEGDIVEVPMPSGQEEFTIIKIEFKGMV